MKWLLIASEEYKYRCITVQHQLLIHEEPEDNEPPFKPLRSAIVKNAEKSNILATDDHYRWINRQPPCQNYKVTPLHTKEI